MCGIEEEKANAFLRNFLVKVGPKSFLLLFSESGYLIKILFIPKTTPQ